MSVMWVAISKMYLYNIYQHVSTLPLSTKTFITNEHRHTHTFLHIIIQIMHKTNKQTKNWRKTNIPDVVHNQPILPCMVPYKKNADMVVVWGCDICRGRRNRWEVVQIAPYFTGKKKKKKTKIRIWKTIKFI